jgi:riboflavin transporter FmnP
MLIFLNYPVASIWFLLLYFILDILGALLFQLIRNILRLGAIRREVLEGLLEMK